MKKPLVAYLAGNTILACITNVHYPCLGPSILCQEQREKYIGKHYISSAIDNSCLGSKSVEQTTSRNIRPLLHVFRLRVFFVQYHAINSECETALSTQQKRRLNTQRGIVISNITQVLRLILEMESDNATNCVVVFIFVHTLDSFGIFRGIFLAGVRDHAISHKKSF